MKDLDYQAIANRLKTKRTQLGYSYQELADKVGMSKSTLQRYETGKIRNIPIARLNALSAALNMEPNELIGVEPEPPAFPAKNLLPFPRTQPKPRIGSIACGEPILAEQNIEGYDMVPDYIQCDFTLVCKGDSMINARIFDGDIVCIRQQPMVENGEIAAVMVGDDEATLKRVRLFDDHISLEAENPMCKPLVFWGEEMNQVRIIGKATHFISTVR